MAKFEPPKVYGAVTVGERGQVVIPAQVRKSFKIKSGDKLIVFGKADIVSLVPAEQFNQLLNNMAEMVAKFKK